MKTVLMTITLVVVTLFSTAQNIEITPMGGYSFLSYMNFYEGRIVMRNNPSYGIKIGFSPIEHSSLEFSYQGTQTDAKWDPYNPWIGVYPDIEFPVNINYFMISIQQERMLTNEKIYGFGGFGLGMSYIHPQDRRIDDLYSFAVSLELGVKISITDRFGVRLQADMQMPIYFQGAGYYVGIGGGGTSSGLSLNTGSYFVQGGFSAGVFVKLGS